MMDEALIDVAVAAAQAGGEVIMKAHKARRPGTPTASTTKGYNDYVTDVDRQAEDRIISIIHEVFPEHDIQAEETPQAEFRSDYRWIIDPLDGTTNFIAGFPFWCVSVAARERGEIVAGAVWDPLRGELYSAERGAGAFRNDERLRVTGREQLDGAFLATGFPFRSKDRIDLYLSLFRQLFLHARAIRRAGSAALDLANVAAGVFDGFFEFKLSSWDVAAGALLIEEAGGRVSDFDGRSAYWERGNVVAGTPGVADGILRVAAGLFSDAEI